MRERKREREGERLIVINGLHVNGSINYGVSYRPGID